MPDRLHEGLTWLAEQFSSTPEEFRAHHREGSGMLLEGLLSLGYAREEAGRVAITSTGRRRIEAMEPSPVDEDEA